MPVFFKILIKRQQRTHPQSEFYEDDNVALVGFGTFEVRKRAARNGRNPATGAPLKIKASKAPAFKAGATLKAAVNGAKK